MAEATKRWTVLVWIAGDNNLSEYGTADIAELKQIGSTDAVDLVVEYDRSGTTATRRYHLHRGTTLEADQVDDLGETNGGDPAVATDFFTWGMTTFPSEHVLAVLWNHGSGIDEADVYARTRGLRPPGRPRRSPGRRRPLFSTTAEQAGSERAIAYDDAARDFLDNVELARVLADVHERTGRRIDVLGFDACLMSMLEIAFELRESVGVVVGSEEVEPGDGWPYERVGRAANGAAGRTPATLGTAIVQAYLDSYAADPPADGITQAALDTARVERVVAAVDDLAAACLATLRTDAGYAAFSRSVSTAQRFQKRDFADLGDLCRQLLARCSDAAMTGAAQAVLDALIGEQGAVLASGVQGDAVARSTGTAIYFPLVGDVTVAYDRLAFARKTRWPELIRAYGSA